MPFSHTPHRHRLFSYARVKVRYFLAKKNGIGFLGNREVRNGLLREMVFLHALATRKYVSCPT